MADNTELILAQGELADQTASQDKIAATQRAAQQKLQRLAGPQAGLAGNDNWLGKQIANDITTHPSQNYRDATLTKLIDGDTFAVSDRAKNYRLAGGPTMGSQGWIDSKEVSHLGWTDPIEHQRVTKQARQMGLPAGLTYEQQKAAVFKQGEIDKLQGLYTAIGRPLDENGKEWTPGPILYDPVKNPMILGDSDNPLNIPVRVADTADSSHDRLVGSLESKDGKHNLAVDQALMGNTYIETAPTTFDAQKVVDALKTQESHGDYKVVNDGGYVGAYQFGAARLSDMGLVKRGTKNSQLKDPSVWTGAGGANSLDAFLGNKQLQDQIALKSVNDLAKQTKGSATGLGDWYGKVMAAHLLGVDGSKNLKNVDGNGTAGTKYYGIGQQLVGGGASSGNGLSAENANIAAAIAKMNDPSRGSSWNPINVTAATVGGFVRSLVDTVDAVVDIGVGAYNRYNGTHHEFLSEDTKNKYQKELGLGMSAKADYNNKLAGQYVDKALKDFDIMHPSTAKDIHWGDAWNAFKLGFSTLENAGNSLGYIGGFASGSLEKAGAWAFGKALGKATASEIAIKTIAKVNDKLAAGTISKEAAAKMKGAIYKSASPEMVAKVAKIDKLNGEYLAATDKVVKKGLLQEYKLAVSEIKQPTQALQYMDKLEQIAKERNAGLIDKVGVKAAKDTAWSAMDWRGKVSSMMATATPYAAYGAVTANQDLDSYYKKHGELATLGHVMSTFTIDSLTGMIDMKVAKDILKGPGSVDKLAERIMASAKDKGTALKILARVSEQAVKYAAVMPEELVQEFVQNWGQAYNVKYGTLTADGLTDNGLIKTAMEQAILAPGSAVHMRAGGSVFNKVTGKVIDTIGKKKDTPVDNAPVTKDIPQELVNSTSVVQGWENSDAKVNQYLADKRNNRAHSLTPDEEKHVANYIKARALGWADKIARLETMLQAPGVEEEDKQAAAAAIDDARIRQGKAWLAYNDVTGANVTLNNRPLDVIKGELDGVNAEIAASQNKDEIATLEHQKKVLEVEHYIAEQLRTEEFGKLAGKIDSKATTEGVNTTGAKVKVEDVLANKLYKGISDVSGEKRGMLEYASTLLNPNIPEADKVNVEADMNKFLESQIKKEGAANTARKTFESNDNGVPVSVPYGYNQDGEPMTFTYGPRDAEGNANTKASDYLIGKITAENELLAKIVSKIEGVRNPVNTQENNNGQDQGTQTETQTNTPTEEGSGPTTTQNEASGGLHETTPGYSEEEVAQLNKEYKDGLTDEAKLVDAIDATVMKMLQIGGDKEKHGKLLGELVDKLYTEYMRENAKGVQTALSSAMTQLEKGEVSVPEQVKLVKMLVDAEIHVKEQYKAVKEVTKSTAILKKTIAQSAKKVAERLWDTLQGIRSGYEDKYTKTTNPAEVTNNRKITRKYNDKAKEELGVRPFSKGATKGVEDKVTISTKERYEELKRAGVKDEKLIEERNNIVNPLKKELADKETQLDSLSADLADSQDKLDKITEEYKKSKSKNTIGAALVSKFGTKDGEQKFPEVMKLMKNILSPDNKEIFKDKLGCENGM